MKIGIVGSGFVGATAAYALIMQGIGREIVLVDKNEKKAESEANDLFHAVPFLDLTKPTASCLTFSLPAMPGFFLGFGIPRFDHFSSGRKQKVNQQCSAHHRRNQEHGETSLDDHIRHTDGETAKHGHGSCKDAQR